MSKKKQKAEKEVADQGNFGLVLYADGGARPSNPGYCGSGIHGYLFSTNPPKKGSGNPNNYLLDTGYTLKTNKKPLPADDFMEEDRELINRVNAITTKPIEKPKNEVTPIQYIDVGISYRKMETNNVGELRAGIYCVEIAKSMIENKIPLLNLTVVCDSEYVKKGIMIYVKSWAKNGWLKSDGKLPANLDDWKELYHAVEHLRSLGVKVVFEWTKGHAGDQGNTLADQEATASALFAMTSMTSNPEKDSLLPGMSYWRGTEAVVFQRMSQPEGYWKNEAKKHPFMGVPTLYFNTLPELNRKGVYALGTRTNDFHEAGKRNGSEGLALVSLSEPDLMVESVIARQQELSGLNNEYYICHLLKLYNPVVVQSYSAWNKHSFYKPLSHNEGMSFINKERIGPVTLHQKPIRLGFRIAAAFDDLEGKLALALKDTPTLAPCGTPMIMETDITHLFYEAKLNKAQEVTDEAVLKTAFKVGAVKIPVKVKYANQGEVKEIDVILTFGIDLPDRNTLKRCETLNPKMSILTWMESPVAMRHATLIRGNDGSVGLWCGYYSNLRLINKVIDLDKLSS